MAPAVAHAAVPVEQQSATAVPASALLTVADVHLPRTGGGTGIRRASFHPCAGAPYLQASRRVAGVWRSFASLEDGQPVEGITVSEDVARYSSAVSAARAVDDYRFAAVLCPVTVSGSSTTTYEVLQNQPLIVRQLTVDTENPAPRAPVYVLFPRVGDLVGVVVTGHTEGDLGLPTAQRRAEQALRRLAPAS